MLRYTIIFTIALLDSSLLFGQNGSRANNIYSLLIQAEITSTTKSVVVVDKPNNDTISTPWIIDAIESKDPQQLELLRFLTRDDSGNSVKAIDTATQNLILNFYKTQPIDTLLKSHFAVSDVKVFLINNFPIRSGSENEWKKFYKKYPGSGGLFQFSNVCYSKDGKEAVMYHSLYRRGLNAHGALVVFIKDNGKWKIKYHINLWQA
jgi:hypothetical protein